MHQAHALAGATLHHHRVRRPRYIHLPVLSHLRVHGPALDYVGLFLLAAVSGFGVNGFGEAALIAAGVYAANHHLPPAPVVLIAAVGAFLGGTVGYLAGRHGGRVAFTAAGPLARLRRRMLARSEEVYLHYDVVAILITPGWAAGIHSVRWRKFLPLNVASALIWAAALGLGSYYLGRRITTDFSDEAGWIVGGVAAALVFIYVVRRALRRPAAGPGAH